MHLRIKSKSTAVQGLAWLESKLNYSEKYYIFVSCASGFQNIYERWNCETVGATIYSSWNNLDSEIIEMLRFEFSNLTD